MSGKGLKERGDLGVFVLQDHDFQNHGPQSEMLGAGRLFLAGARVSRLTPSEDLGDDPSLLQTEYAAEDGLGTIGDIHPWGYWGPVSRSERAIGSWSMAFGALTTGGGTGGSSRGYDRALKPIEVQPIRDGEHTSDPRYKTKKPGWPSCFPSLPQGVLTLMLPGTEETSQQDYLLHTDPRLFAVHTEGPGEAGSLVCDLQPEAEPCMDGSSNPGIGGRHARLQSHLRVIPLAGDRPLPNLDAKAGNGLAWNLSTGGIDEIAGFGLVWGRLHGGVAGPSTGGPITPVGPVTPGSGNAPAGSPPPRSSGMPGSGGGAPATAGSPPVTGGSNSGAGGSGGTESGEAKQPCDFGEFKAKSKSLHGVACAAHIPSFGPFHLGSSGDQHKIGTDKDGHPINSLHIATGAYYFQDQKKDGPFLFEGDYIKPQPFPLSSPVHLEWDKEESHPKVGGSGEGKWRWRAEVPFLAPDVPGEPGIPPDTGPPGTPTTPTGPGTPTGPRVPGGPSTGGPGTPTTPRGPATGSPGIPGGPGTGAPTTRRRGYTRDFPENAPGGAGSPPPGPSGPPGPPPRWNYEFKSPWNPPLPGTDAPAPGGNPEIERWIQENLIKSKRKRRFGGTGPSDQSLYSIFHPMQESFGSIAFRPELMFEGAYSTEHNDLESPALYRYEERTRPQVVVARSWGAQTGTEWDYTQHPLQSRARGGTATGGVLFCPPHLEMEDYFGVGETSRVRVTQTHSYLTVAPNVAFACGTPNTDGELNEKSVVIGQSVLGNDPLTIYQLDPDRLPKMLVKGEVDQGTCEVTVDLAGGNNNCITIPRGSPADRPTTLSKVGGLRIEPDEDVANIDWLTYYDHLNGVWLRCAVDASSDVPGFEADLGDEDDAIATTWDLGDEYDETTGTTGSWDLGFEA